MITKEELWFLLEKYNTTAIATICGKISGNLEAIDIDVKWMAGIDTQLFSEIKSLLPDVWNRLRIHQSPSGGFHILYRAEGGVIPGNRKIASRPSTEAEIDKELKDNPDAKASKFKCFIETRGEGGYVAAPPSVGYTVYQDNPIPTITWEEREQLMNICSSFNQIIKEERTYNATKSDSNYYDVNPFEHFNNSVEGEQVLMKYGWEFHSKNNRALYFSRPGSKSKGIHATFLFKGRYFYFFTTNSAFDNQRCYKPATVFGRLEFKNDMKKVYHALVGMGYGKIKPAIERSIVKNSALVGKPLPPNLSESAKNTYTSVVVQLNDNHPHGIFWEVDDDGLVSINRERLMQVAEGLGYRYQLDPGCLCQIDGYLIHKRDLRNFQDTIKNYIHEEDGDFYMQICNAYEAWIEKHGEFTISRLMLLEEETIIVDTANSCYKFFNNGYLFITAEEIKFSSYENITGLIWKERIQDRNFVKGVAEGKYVDFLRLACGYDSKVEYISKAIGYLSHEYKDEATAYIIVLTEECPDPKQGGGSGKNIFSNLFKMTTTFQSIAGSQVSYDSKFLQAWNYERIFAVSDVPKKFDFGFLKELSGGSGVLKKLFKDERSVEVEKMPKFIIQTNFSYEVSDGGLKRRIIPIEFTDFFTKAGGVDVHFGCYFPTGWTNEDWIGFDNLIAESIQTWLKGGRKLKPIELTKGGAIKQFEQTYGQSTREFIEENWQKDWIRGVVVSSEDFNKLYDKFCHENGIKDLFKVSGIKMNKALADYCAEKGYGFIGNKPIRVDGLVTKGKEFIRPDDVPPF